jgi:hypothetical protein
VKPYFDPTRKKTFKKKWKTTSKKKKEKKGRRPQKKKEDDLKKKIKIEKNLNFIFGELEWQPQKKEDDPKKNVKKFENDLKKEEEKGRRPKQKWKMNQSTIVNSPSFIIYYYLVWI